MKAAIAGIAPRREAECSYDFEADIYSAPRASRLLPFALPALLLAMLAAFRLR